VSDNERSEVLAFRELSMLVRHLGDELASFRKRALTAESRVKAIEVAGSTNTEGLAERVASLEAENQDLRSRLDAARGRARHMLERVRFLRQQQEDRR
jgi:hypothetical protein